MLDMEFFKKHVDTAVVLGAILSSVFWMNGQFNNVDKRFSEIEKELAIVKTVLIMKNIMPSDLVIKE
jgi:hypothetical protein